MEMRNSLERRALCTYEIGRAKNGFVFGEYELATDEYKTLVARTPAELKEIMETWFSERLPEIISWAEREEAERNKKPDLAR